MIFVTVGMQLSFDRLIKAVEKWAIESGQRNIVFQVGPGGYIPSGFTAKEFLNPEQFENYIKEAEAIVGHAGMGTILKALELAKPVVIMPRLERYGEHRNDHQVHTAEKFGSHKGVFVASSSKELSAALNSTARTDNGQAISQYASDSLCSFIHEFLCKNISR